MLQCPAGSVSFWQPAGTISAVQPAPSGRNIQSAPGGSRLQKASAAPTRILVAYKTVSIAKKDNSTAMKRATVAGTDITKLKAAYSLYNAPHPVPITGYTAIDVSVARYGVGVSLGVAFNSDHTLHLRASIGISSAGRGISWVAGNHLQTGLSQSTSISLLGLSGSRDADGSYEYGIGLPGGYSHSLSYTW